VRRRVERRADAEIKERQLGRVQRTLACHAEDPDTSSDKETINALGALNRPQRSSGGITASTASSFFEASIPRVPLLMRRRGRKPKTGSEAST
jgi:hypothetical protein